MLESVSPVDGRSSGRIRCAGLDDYEQVVRPGRRRLRRMEGGPGPEEGRDREAARQCLPGAQEGPGGPRELGDGEDQGGGRRRSPGDDRYGRLRLGQSRMLYGLSMHSERPCHRMYEQWHPLGPVGVITAFNFPVAVWAWNAMLALIAGDTVVWKPSSKVPLSAIAATNIAWRVLKSKRLPDGILNIVIGRGETVGEALISDPTVPLVSFTGSVRWGVTWAEAVNARLGRTLLELGGNNGVIVTPSADLDLAVQAIRFGAVGTAGQRCTSTRRVIVHESVYPAFSGALIEA